MRGVRQLDSCRHAARHPAADGRSLLRVLGAGDPAGAFLRQVERAAIVRLRPLPRSASAHPIAGRDIADPVRRQATADHGRSRSTGLASAWAHPDGRDHCGGHRKRRCPVGPRQARKHPVSGPAQFLARRHRGVEPDPGQDRQRCAGAAARRRLCARRIWRATEHRARQWPASGPADHSQERQRLDVVGRRAW